jgi:phosphonate transport system substrate-binding protein
VLLNSLLSLGILSSCSASPPQRVEQLTVGVVSYDQGARSLVNYQPLQVHLSQQTHALVQLEPVFNELNALDQISQQRWSLVFAPPGLAAIAMDRYQYVPLLRVQGEANQRSVLVVREDSTITDLAGLSNQVVALGQPGSATGYYLPLYDLYGLTLAEIRFAPTPKTILSWIADGTVTAGALSDTEFQQFQAAFPAVKFRVLHRSRTSPPGLVLLSPTVSQDQQFQIKQALNQANNTIIRESGYLLNTALPDYQEFIKLVNKVKPIEARTRQKPAVLINTP